MHPVLFNDYTKALVYGNTALLILMIMSQNNKTAFFFMAGQSFVGLGLLIFEVCGSYSDRPHSVRLLRSSDRPVARTST